MTGMAADLFMIDSRRLDLVGATLDPKALLGTVGYKGNVDGTIVNGEVVVEGGRLCRMNEEAVGQRAREQVMSYLHKGGKAPSRAFLSRYSA